MIFCDIFSQKMNMLSLSAIMIAMIAICNFEKIYNRVAARFFLNFVNKKRIFFSCSISKFKSINNLLKNKVKKGKIETPGLEERDENTMLSLIADSMIAIAGMKNQCLGVIL